MYIHVYFRRPPSQTTPKNPGPKSFSRKEKSHIILNWKSLRSWDQVARMLWLCFPRNHTLVHQQQPATIYWLPSIAKELKWKHHLVIETLQSFVVKHAVEWEKNPEGRDRDQETTKWVLRLMLPANPVPWKTNPKKIKKKSTKWQRKCTRSFVDSAGWYSYHPTKANGGWRERWRTRRRRNRSGYTNVINGTTRFECHRFASI